MINLIRSIISFKNIFALMIIGSMPLMFSGNKVVIILFISSNFVATIPNVLYIFLSHNKIHRLAQQEALIIPRIGFANIIKASLIGSASFIGIYIGTHIFWIAVLTITGVSEALLPNYMLIGIMNVGIFALIEIVLSLEVILNKAANNMIVIGALILNFAYHFAIVINLG